MNKDIVCTECLLYGRHPDDCKANPLVCLDEMRKQYSLQTTENYLMYDDENPPGWDEVSPFTMGR